MAIPTFWQRCLDTLLPPATESKLVRTETTQSFLTNYQPRQRNTILLLSQYQSPHVQAAVHANKFYSDRHASQLLAALLHEYLTRLDTIDVQLIQIIPIPLSTKREKARGYNQVHSIISNLRTINSTHFQMITALQRLRDTKPQSHLTRKERLKNVTGVFGATRHTKCINPYQPILLLDDVATTGATLQSAKQALPEEVRNSKQLQLIAVAG